MSLSLLVKHEQKLVQQPEQLKEVIYSSLKNKIKENNIINIIISYTFKSFDDERELKIAINKYLSKDSKNKELIINIYGSINHWDVSNVTNMSNMFRDFYEFNQDLSRWDVSNVTDMSNMFRNCYKFNQDLSRWNVLNFTDM